MIVNIKCNNCNEPTKFVTGFWDGKDGAHGCLYDCKNIQCEAKQLIDNSKQEAIQNKVRVRQINNKNNICIEQLIKLRKDYHISIMQISKIVGCSIADYSSYEHEQKLFPLEIYQKCMDYLNRKI